MRISSVTLEVYSDKKFPVSKPFMLMSCQVNAIKQNYLITMTVSLNKSFQNNKKNVSGQYRK